MAEFTEEQKESLRALFRDSDVDKNGFLDQDELRKLLLEFEIDSSFAPAMLRILMGNKREGGVKFDDIINFFEIIFSGDLKVFFQLLFQAIDTNGDGRLNADDLVSFGQLVGDSVSETDARDIIEQCGHPQDGTVNFDDFWRWYRVQHGAGDDDDEPASSSAASPEYEFTV